MRPFGFALSLSLLFSSFASGQTAPSDTTQKRDALTYQDARLVKMTASISTQPRETRHTTMLDTIIVSDKIVTYHFLVRSGGVEYVSKYTPKEQPGNLPDAWWKGNAPVGIRVVKHRLYIKSADGSEVSSRLIRQAQVAKAS